MKHALRILTGVCLLAGLVVVLAGCNVVPTYTPPEYQTSAPATTPAASTSGTYDPANAQPRDPSLDLLAGGRIDDVRLGDQLTIIMSDTPAPGLAPHRVTVGGDGVISLPFNQSIMAAGKTRFVLQQEIRAIYVPNYFKQMTVTIQPEDRFFTVGGEVRTPQRVSYVGTMTVLKAVAAVGGFTEFSNKRRIEITRANGQKDTVDSVKALENPQLDLAIYPGDHIHVPRRVI